VSTHPNLPPRPQLRVPTLCALCKAGVPGKRFCLLGWKGWGIAKRPLSYTQPKLSFRPERSAVEKPPYWLSSATGTNAGAPGPSPLGTWVSTHPNLPPRPQLGVPYPLRSLQSWGGKGGASRSDRSPIPNPNCHFDRSAAQWRNPRIGSLTTQHNPGAPCPSHLGTWVRGMPKAPPQTQRVEGPTIPSPNPHGPPPTPTHSPTTSAPHAATKSPSN